MDRQAVAGIEDALVDLPVGLEAISLYVSDGRFSIYLHPFHGGGRCFHASGSTFAEAYEAARAQWRKPIPADILLTAYGSAVDSFASRTRTGEG